MSSIETNTQAEPTIRLGRDTKVPPTGAAEGEYTFVETDASIKVSDLERHMMVVGPTGTGKTTFCVGMVEHALDLGWQVLVVDGKGDGVLANSVSRIAEARDRNVLAIDFNDPDSPSINPFTDLPSDDVAEIVAAPLENIQKSMWTGRARTMTTTLVSALHASSIEMDIPSIDDWLQLDRMEKLAQDARVPPDHQARLQTYLRSLPGYQDAMIGKQGNTPRDQHGYLHMQIVEPLRVLGHRYGHVFRREGSRNLSDEIEKGTVVTVTCPAISRSDDDMQIIGNVIAAYIRSIATKRLGRLRTSLDEAMAADRGESRKPLLILFDELESYVVGSMIPIVSMGRSLGLRLVFATQRMPDVGSTDAMRTIAVNTGIKVFKRADDARRWKRENLSEFDDYDADLKRALDRIHMLQKAHSYIGDTIDTIRQTSNEAMGILGRMQENAVDLSTPLAVNEALVYDSTFRRILVERNEIDRPMKTHAQPETILEVGRNLHVTHEEIRPGTLVSDIAAIVERHAD